MKICKIKETQELALVIIESKNWLRFVDASGETSETRSLNLLLTESGNKVAKGDDEIEIIKEEED